MFFQKVLCPTLLVSSRMRAKSYEVRFGLVDNGNCRKQRNQRDSGDYFGRRALTYAFGAARPESIFFTLTGQWQRGTAFEMRALRGRIARPNSKKIDIEPEANAPASRENAETNFQNGGAGSLARRST